MYAMPLWQALRDAAGLQTPRRGVPPSAGRRPMHDQCLGNTAPAVAHKPAAETAGAARQGGVLSYLVPLWETCGALFLF